MTDRLARHRWWVACMYCLAAVLAWGLHAPHGPTSEAAGHASADSCAADHRGGHDDDQPRWDDAGPAPCASTCPACDYTLSHQAPLADRAVAAGGDRGALACRWSPSAPALFSLPTRCRAPPLA